MPRLAAALFASFLIAALISAPVWAGGYGDDKKGSRTLVDLAEGDVPSNPGDNQFIIGTSGDDVITLQGNNNVVLLRGGNDVVEFGVNSSNNKVVGGTGDDEVVFNDGEAHYNKVYLGDGNDEVEFDDNSDYNVVDGGEGDDEIEFDDHSDHNVVDGGPGNDEISFGDNSHDNKAEGGPGGADEISFGEAGSDNVCTGGEITENCSDRLPELPQASPFGADRVGYCIDGKYYDLVYDQASSYAPTGSVVHPALLTKGMGTHCDYVKSASGQTWAGPLHEVTYRVA